MRNYSISAAAIPMLACATGDVSDRFERDRADATAILLLSPDGASGSDAGGPAYRVDAAFVEPDVGGPDVAPETGVPEASAPDADVADADVADASVPDASAPDASVPDASAPEASVPDAGAQPQTPAVMVVSAGDLHTCAIVDGGKVKCWGRNAHGELGIGDTSDHGSASGQMGNALPYVDLGAGRTATGVSAGSGYTCAILDNGKVKCWGMNLDGQLGLGDANNRGDAPGEMGDALPYVDLGTGRTAAALSAGYSHTCAVLDNARVKCWGPATGGQLGLGDKANRGSGPAEMGDALPYVDLGTGRTARSLAAGSGHTCAVLDNATVKCWGGSLYGQLGIGDKSTRGDGPADMGDALPAVSLGTGRTAVLVSAGDGHTCALLDNGSVKCWGRNSAGQLGLGDSVNRGDGPGEMGDALAAVALGTGRTATAIDAGNLLSCARLDNGSVKCWGRSNLGQLGLGDTLDRGDAPGEMGDALAYVGLGTGRTAIGLSAGDSHTCSLLDNGKLKCWGYNYLGRLGLGDQSNRGDGAGEMGDSLPHVDLGTK